MIKEYQIAVIYTVNAETWAEAKAIAQIELASNDQAAVIYDYETNSSGQRVVCLPGICVDHDTEGCKVC